MPLKMHGLCIKPKGKCAQTLHVTHVCHTKCNFPTTRSNLRKVDGVIRLSLLAIMVKMYRYSELFSIYRTISLSGYPAQHSSWTYVCSLILLSFQNTILISSVIFLLPSQCSRVACDVLIFNSC